MSASSPVSPSVSGSGSPPTDAWPLGVFTSIDAGFGCRLDVAAELGVPTVHVHSPHQGGRTADDAARFLEQTQAAGVTITCLFAGFDGETYESIARTAETIGLVPPATRQARAAEFLEIAAFGQHLGCPVMGMHIGFVPEAGTDDYADLLATTQRVLDALAEHDQRLHLETGQETAEHLIAFLDDVDRPNIGVNFDPANMILYGTGDPIDALRQLGDRVASVHCKDATWAAEPVRGTEWGAEVPLGDGDVGLERYLQTLHEIGYTGPLTIERELSSDPVAQKRDIGTALERLRTLRSEILG